MTVEPGWACFTMAVGSQSVTSPLASEPARMPYCIADCSLRADHACRGRKHMPSSEEGSAWWRTWLFLVAMPYEPQAMLWRGALRGTEVPTRGTSRPGLAKSKDSTCRSRVRGQGMTGLLYRDDGHGDRHGPNSHTEKHLHICSVLLTRRRVGRATRVGLCECSITQVIGDHYWTIPRGEEPYVV